MLAALIFEADTGKFPAGLTLFITRPVMQTRQTSWLAQDQQGTALKFPVEWATLWHIKCLGSKALLKIFFAVDMHYAKPPSTVTPGREFALERFFQ